MYNTTETAVNVTGWTVQYASSSGSFSLASNMYVELSGFVAPHGYYLTKAADGNGGAVSLPTPDEEGGIAMAAGSGKAALVSNGEAITGKDDPDVVDFVGFGGANAYEGSGGTPAPSNLLSAQRKSDATGYVPGQGNGYDTNDNKTDFFAAAPTPQNTASPAEPPLGDDVVAGVAASPTPGAVVKSGWIESGKTYDQIVGVLTYSFGNYLLIPRSRFDVIEETFSVIAETPPGIVPPGTGIALFSPQPGAAVYYTTDGSEPTPETGTPYTAPIVVNDDEATIRAIAAADGKVSDVYTFRYIKQKTYEGLAIHDVQSAGHASPIAGHKVNDLEGIVTQRVGTSKFYLQTVPGREDGDDRTSEAILVYSSYSVAPGDRVLVDGTVEERQEEGYDDANDLLTTAIGSAFVTRTSRGNALPAPVALEQDRVIPKSIIDNDGMTVFDPEEDALDFYESLESMRLELGDARVAGPLDFEIPVVLGEQPGETMTPNGGILLAGEDLNPQRVLVKKEVDGYKTGDRFLAPIVGVLGYDYSNFKVIPEGNLPEAEKGAATRERTSIVFDEDKLTIAGFNIENFWDNPSAAGPEKKRKIAQAIVENLKTPDIVGLIEVQDNNGQTDDGTTDASKSYEALIQAIAAAGGPTYAYTDIAPENNQDGGAPGGNIRVGYLYNPDRVTLTEKPRGDATTAVAYDKKDGLSHNPGRIAPTNDAFDSSRKPLAAEFEFKGERVIVVNNHFNSKGGDEAPFGAIQPLPPILGSEAQRREIASIVNDFVAGVLKEDQKANVVLLGDFNDFQFSKTLEILKGDELVNMVDQLPLPERYSYVYQGNSQTLDHIFVTERLAPATTLDIVRINADFSDRDGRVSDRDPLLVQLDLFATGIGNGKGQGYEHGVGTQK